MPKQRDTNYADVPPAVRHYLLTGEELHIEGQWALFEALHGPLGVSREEMKRFDPDVALEPYRAALRAEGLTLPDLTKRKGRRQGAGQGSGRRG